MAKKFTMEQLADRWMDRREIQNLMGKLTYYKMLAKHDKIYKDFFASSDDTTLGINSGYYKGKDAIDGYYKAVYANAETRSKLMLQLFPDFLGKYSKKELHGVGTCNVDAITTCIIEQSEDGMTAKGLWYVLGEDNDILPQGPYSMYAYGYMAADFVREGDDWKVWHLLDIEDISCPVGKNWAKPYEEDPILPEFAPLAELTLPEPTVPCAIHEVYSPSRVFKPFVQIPEPYETFADTFSYGI